MQAHKNRNLREPHRLGVALRRWRLNAGLSLRDAPLSPGGLSKVEAGVNRPHLSTLEKLCDTYEMAVVIIPGQTLLITVAEAVRALQ